MYCINDINFMIQNFSINIKRISSLLFFILCIAIYCNLFFKLFFNILKLDKKINI